MHEILRWTRSIRETSLSSLKPGTKARIQRRWSKSLGQVIDVLMWFTRYRRMQLTTPSTSRTVAAWRSYSLTLLCSRRDGSTPARRRSSMAHSDCWWVCVHCETVRSLEKTCHTWALLRWWFTTKRRYIKCMYLYLYRYLYGYMSTSVRHTVRCS